MSGVVGDPARELLSEDCDQRDPGAPVRTVKQSIGHSAAKRAWIRAIVSATSDSFLGRIQVKRGEEHGSPGS